MTKLKTRLLRQLWMDCLLTTDSVIRGHSRTQLYFLFSRSAGIDILFGLKAETIPLTLSETSIESRRHTECRTEVKSGSDV